MPVCREGVTSIMSVSDEHCKGVAKLETPFANDGDFVCCMATVKHGIIINIIIIIKQRNEVIVMSENKIQVWDYESSEVRTVQVNGEPWFVGKDVAAVLGYSNPRDAINKRVDDEDKGVAKCDTLGGVQDLTIINESGLYSLVLSSKLPNAKKFKRWVTNEVLPSIRKHGAYMTPETIKKVMLTPDFIISLAGELKNEQEKNKKLTLELESKDEELSTLKP